MVTIDGSHGEGGGQVLRTSLALSALTAQPVEVTSIRAGRPKPGLAAQHLTGVRAAAAACGAEVEGDALGSQRLVFRPGPPRAGHYTFDVCDIRPSAGSVNLILQTILPILALAEGPSHVTLKGGTHVPMAPCFEYVRHVFLPAVSRFGVQADVTCQAAGYYPRGGGHEELRVMGCGGLGAARFEGWAGPPEVLLISRTTKLPEHVRQRQLAALRQALAVRAAAEVCEDAPGPAPGTVAFAAARALDGGSVLACGGASALGERGRKAEDVGREAGNSLRATLDSKAAVDLHLADQLLLYAAIAQGESSFAVQEWTEHARTNVWVVEQFMGSVFEVASHADGTALVEVAGQGLGRR